MRKVGIIYNDVWPGVWQHYNVIFRVIMFFFSRVHTSYSKGKIFAGKGAMHNYINNVRATSLLLVVKAVLYYLLWRNDDKIIFYVGRLAPIVFPLRMTGICGTHVSFSTGYQKS